MASQRGREEERPTSERSHREQERESIQEGPREGGEEGRGREKEEMDVSEK